MKSILMEYFISLAVNPEKAFNHNAASTIPQHSLLAQLLMNEFIN